MGDGNTRRAEDAVRRLLPGLEPVAVLLTDSPADAERLLAAALPGRGRPDPRMALRRLVATQQEAATPTGSADAGRPDPHDPALAEALRSSPAADRAAAVLRLVAGLTEAELPGVLPSVPPGDPVARLAAAVALHDERERRAREQYRAVYLPPGAAPSSEPPREDPLPDRLAELARRRALPPGAVLELIARVDAESDAVRRRRRTTAVRAGAALVVVAVLAVGLPRLTRSDPAGPAAAVTSVYAGPTRGSLAGDGAFLRAVGSAAWAGSLGAPAPSGRRVVYAGDGPGGRWVLVAAGGTTARPAAAAWFAGPSGAAPDGLRMVSAQVDPDPAEPLALTSPAAGALTVVGLPGDQVRVSDAPQVDDVGEVGRTFRPVRTVDGVAVATVPQVTGVELSAVRVEVVRDGAPVPAPLPDVVEDPSATAVPVPVTRLRPAPPPAVGDGAVEPTVRQVLGQLGEPVGSADATVLWAGDLPGPQDRPARLSVVAVRRPSGAFVVLSPYGYAVDLTGRSGTSFCGTGTIPAQEPLDGRVVGVRCDLSDGAADRELSRFLVVIGPRAATTVRLRDVAGAQLAELPAPDGVAVLRSPGPVASVEAVLPDGRVVRGDLPVDADLTG